MANQHVPRSRRKEPRVIPRGLSREEAAYYVGISTTKFDEMVERGDMPGARKIDARRLWDIREVDDAFDLLPRAASGASKGGDPWLTDLAA